MSSNLSDSKHDRDLLNRIAQLEKQMREKGTVQVQGENAIQIGYTPDSVYPFVVAPNSGLIGTFLCTLQYDTPLPESIVFGELDIAVNKGTDIFNSTFNLSAYFGGLRVEEVNDQYLVNGWHSEEGYYPKIKVVRIYTFPSASSDTFYIHTRWRYVGVGKTLVPVTGDITILP
jgi:hypothetical protein